MTHSFALGLQLSVHLLILSLFAQNVSHLRSSMRQCAETPSCVRKRPLVSHLSRPFEFFFCQPVARCCCVLLRSVQTISPMLVPLVSTPNASTSRAVGTKRRKFGGWGAQSIEVHVVKELRLGAELRCSEGERRVSRIASKLGGSARKRKGGYMEFNTE